jgi:hypothetical protein
MDYRLSSIEHRYNANFDVIPDGPAVTWAEYSIACVVSELAKEVARLRTELDELKQVKGGHSDG